MGDALPEIAYITAIRRLTRFLESYRPGSYDKDAVVKAFAEQWELSRERCVYFNDAIAFRFSHVKPLKAFSNTVAGLSRLRRFDERPFVSVVVRPSGLELLMANSSFVDRISHSSHRLRVDNIVGSFNGSNIVRTYDGITNAPENFEQLFRLHRRCSWEENIARIIVASSGIRARGKKFEPSAEAAAAIANAPHLAAAVSGTREYRRIQTHLDALVASKRRAILEAAERSDVNRRGNGIEQVITDAANQHGLDDLRFELPGGVTALIDIKTKMLDLQSNPKAYNIDKVLRCLSTGASVVSFYFIGVERASQSIRTRLVSIFDTRVLDATTTQTHWSGRNSRGATQLTGDLSMVFEPDFTERVDTRKARAFLTRLLAL